MEVSKHAQMKKKKKKEFLGKKNFFLETGGCRGKLRRPRCRLRWDTHLNSRSLLNWNSSLAAAAAGSVKKCRNGQVKTIWLPISGSHNFSEAKYFFIRKRGAVGES